MARRKQLSPMQRINSGEIMQTAPKTPEQRALYANGTLNGRVATQMPAKTTTTSSSSLSPTIASNEPAQGSVLSLFICVGGIYASFLTWGFLQERITTTPYASEPSTFLIKDSSPALEYFRYPVFVNTIQALFAFLSGSTYLLITTGQYEPLPSRDVIFPLLLVSLTTTLASPFGYASLAHVDYLTFVLAKSCKLLPVMALHITLFNKRYPLSKYLIVLMVTAGVAVFTIFHAPKSGGGKKKKGAQTSSIYGLSLLAVNLLFDGLTNTVQDHIFKSPHRYGTVKGPQVMVSTNFLGFMLQAAYLLGLPFVPTAVLPTVAHGARGEFSGALAFLSRHPSVLYDVLGFAACGAIGQLFIFATLERFSSLLLVTVTVTRKMLTMVLSVFAYGHSLTPHQWGGVALVFGGISAEAFLARQEKIKKEKERQTEKAKETVKVR